MSNKSRNPASILVTGGAGFIGTNFIRYLLNNNLADKHRFTGAIVNLDALTYAGNPENLSDVSAAVEERYRFVRGDIADRELVERILREEAIDTIVHFAAESHVDRSIHGPAAFIRTNVLGTFSLLEAARAVWSQNGTFRDDVVFHHVSTDEVFGSLGATGYFTESTAYDPRSPYSASKASSDHIVRAYYSTYGMPIVITNCSNNYGPYQFPEKLIPVMILNIKERKPLPIYGDGKNVRDWVYVEDHNAAVWSVIRNGGLGESYNIGGDNEWENLRLVQALCDIVSDELGRDVEETRKLVTFVADRPGHDQRYAIDCSKIKRELGWRQHVTFEEGLRRTVRWYLENDAWIDSVRSGEYQRWVDTNYGQRTSIFSKHS